jgi:hypothetical protein
VTPRGVDGGILAVAGIFLAAALLGVVVYATHNPSTVIPESLPASPVQGVVVRIDEESLTQVNQIDLLMANGRKVTLSVGILENMQQFSPSHLAVHMATGQPILAFYRVEDGRALVYRLEDAPVASPAPGSSPSSAPNSSGTQTAPSPARS